MAIHLRDLLDTCRILTPIDRHPEAFEDWLAPHLGDRPNMQTAANPTLPWLSCGPGNH